MPTSFLINDRLDLVDLNAVFPLLPAWRQEVLLRYRRETDRRQCAAAWLLLERLLREECGISRAPEVAFLSHGKPYFPSLPGLHFNLSHCAEAVACAVGDTSVGVDIEAVRPIERNVAQRVLNDEELLRVDRSEEPQVEFIRLWTLKESLLKLTGEGLTDDLPTLLSRAGDVRFSTMVDPRRRYVCTVATLQER